MPRNYPTTDQPFEKGDEVIVAWDFHNEIGGKKAIVESCEQSIDVHYSGWKVKIDKYPNPIDAGWLVKIPKP